MTFRLSKKLTQAVAQQLEIPSAAGEFKYIPAFIGIEDVVVLWDELGPFPHTVLGHIIESNQPALMMVDELGCYVPASDERRAWAKRYVLKCWQKPRLRYASRMRIYGGVGWRVNDLAPVLYEDEASEAQEGSAGSQAKANQRLREQERVILAKLVELGYNPKALPKNLPGKAGVPAACRRALSESPLFKGTTTFKKAWERMARFCDIKYSD